MGPQGAQGVQGPSGPQGEPGPPGPGGSTDILQSTNTFTVGLGDLAFGFASCGASRPIGGGAGLGSPVFAIGVDLEQSFPDQECNFLFCTEGWRVQVANNSQCCEKTVTVYAYCAPPLPDA